MRLCLLPLLSALALSAAAAAAVEVNLLGSDRRPGAAKNILPGPTPAAAGPATSEPGNGGAPSPLPSPPFGFRLRRLLGPITGPGGALVALCIPRVVSCSANYKFDGRVKWSLGIAEPVIDRNSGGGGGGGGDDK